MKYQISGADATNGTERNVTVEADNETIALGLAKAKGIFPYSVEVLSTVLPTAATSDPTHPHHKTRAEHSGDGKVLSAVSLRSNTSDDRRFVQPVLGGIIAIAAVLGLAYSIHYQSNWRERAN